MFWSMLSLYVFMRTYDFTITGPTTKTMRHAVNRKYEKLINEFYEEWSQNSRNKDD